MTERHDADVANEALLDPQLLYSKEYCIGEQQLFQMLTRQLHTRISADEC